MSVTAIRILAGAFAAATALTIALPAATAAPALTGTQSQSCLALRLALDRAERELSQSNTSQHSGLETRIRRLERQLLAANC
ncbi:hypothetical protein [Nocardia goodfellowii]|uniref:Uncharacterized protein n=1 Tax=Nocardia goodfellowii TaxID=882446 RepID=A0ABS4QQ72_9NOCA|nr:hypothetical protein [Nocardia goodfellowii]MBP2193849.1 hypothetical protein [Nocardia goodfellowii]